MESGAAASNDNPTRPIRKRERSTRPLPFFMPSRVAKGYPEYRTMKTAAKSTPNTNTSVSRPKSGESRRRRFTFVVNSKECFCLRMRTFGPMSQPWIKDTTTNRSTSVSFVRTIGGQKESGTEKSMTLPRRTAPVTTKRNRAPQLSLRNRRASFTNPLCAERRVGILLQKRDNDKREKQHATNPERRRDQMDPDQNNCREFHLRDCGGIVRHSPQHEVFDQR